MLKIRSTAAAVAVAAVLAAGCGRGGEEEAEALPVDETATVDEAEVANQGPQQTVWNCGEVKKHVYALVNTLVGAEAEAEGRVEVVVAESVTRAAAEAALRQAAASAAAPVEEPAGESMSAENLDELHTALGEVVGSATERLESLRGGDGGDDAEAAADQNELEVTVASARSGFGSADEKAMNEACELYGQHESALELWAVGDRGDACDVWRPAKTAADAAQSRIDTAALHPLVSKFWVGATGSVSEGSGRCLAEQAN